MAVFPTFQLAFELFPEQDSHVRILDVLLELPVRDLALVLPLARMRSQLESDCCMADGGGRDGWVEMQRLTLRESRVERPSRP
jgi:hypothetical protein